MSDNQIKKIIDKIGEEKNTIVKLRNKAFVILLWGSGLRINEALSLKTNDIKNDYIIILGKGKRKG